MKRPSSAPLSVLAAVMWLQLDRAESISCFTCSSRNGTDTNCQDRFNPAMSTYTESCKVAKKEHIGLFPAHYCLKVIGNTVDTGVELVIRACSLENMDNQCGVFRFGDDTFQGCILTCDFDGCNGRPPGITVQKWNLICLVSLTCLLTNIKLDFLLNLL